MGLFELWWQNKLNSPDRVERYYAYLVTYLVLLTSVYIIFKPVGLGAPLCTLWALLLILATMIQVWSEQSDQLWKYTEFSKCVQFFLLLIAVAVYYDGTNVVNRYRYSFQGDYMLYDESLVHADTLLLGWAFPKGQLALFLDANTRFGVTSPIAPFYHEILQIYYVSYYFWGNAIAAYFGFLYFYLTVYRQGKNSKKRIQWRRIQMFLCAWVGAFLVNFTFNLFFPAVSPRIYLRNEYVNGIHGFWLCDAFRGALVKAAKNTFSAFPSGHCGLSWLAAYVSYRVRLSKFTVYAQTSAAVIISIATLVMRYHYFVDFLAGFVLVVVGAVWGQYQSNEEYSKALSAPPSITEKWSQEEEMELVNLLEGETTGASKKDIHDTIAQMA